MKYNEFVKNRIHYVFRLRLGFVHLSNLDMAAKRHKKHKNKISEPVISMGYNEL